MATAMQARKKIGKLIGSMDNQQLLEVYLHAGKAIGGAGDQGAVLDVRRFLARELEQRGLLDQAQAAEQGNG